MVIFIVIWFGDYIRQLVPDAASQQALPPDAASQQALPPAAPPTSQTATEPTENVPQDTTCVPPSTASNVNISMAIAKLPLTTSAPVDKKVDRLYNRTTVYWCSFYPTNEYIYIY